MRQYDSRLNDIFNLAVYLKGEGKIHIDPCDCNPEVLGKFLLMLLSQKSFREIKFAVQVPLYSKQNVGNMYCNDLSEKEREQEVDSWIYWNKLHKAASYSKQIEVALIMSENLPENDVSIYRWLGETIQTVIVPYTVFITNKAQYPIMTKRHQNGECIIF
jgi:hypothetical protein